MYRILSNQYHAQVESVPLNDDWSLPENIISRSQDAKLVFLGSPNNPTGNRYDPDLVHRLINESPALVVIDEAYAEFSDQSILNDLDDLDSVVVLRTLSKAFGLAGARVGFLIGRERLVKGIDTVRLPYNLNSLSQALGEIVLSNRDRYEETWRTIVRERGRLHGFLEEHNFNPESSEANFVLFSAETPEELYDHLLDDGIRIRKFSDERLSQYLRVTVGTPDENDRFCASLESY
jgi:histidinol-phosphate aminotransferase